MSSTKKAKTSTPAVPIEEPLSVDYAPTGRASCKKCQGVIKEGSIRVGRLVRSRFHDGFDTQLLHWNCGAEYAQSLDEFKGWMENLKWDDVVQLCESMGESFVEDSALVEEYRKRNVALNKASAHLSELPTQLLRSIFEANDLVFSERAKAISLARDIADNLFYGKLPPCPTCNTNGLYQSGTDIRCHGWFSASTKCTFKFRLANLLQNRPNEYHSIPVGDELMKSRLGRSGMINTPEEVSSHKVFKTLIIPKDVQAIRKKVLGIKANTGGSGLATSIVFDSEDETCADSKNWLIGMKFVFLGIPANEVDTLTKKIQKFGGIVYEDVIVAGPDRTTHLVIGEDEMFKEPKSARYRKCKDAGIPIVKEDFVHAATSAEIEPVSEQSTMPNTPSTVKQIEVTGRSKKLPNAIINGVYTQMNELIDDRPAYHKPPTDKCSTDLYIYYSAERKKWKIAPTLNDKGHVAISLDPKSENPQTCKSWEVFSGKEAGFVLDEKVAIRDSGTKKRNHEKTHHTPTGVLLRQRKYLKNFIVEGSVGKKLGTIKENILQTQNGAKKSKSKLPSPIVGSPILTMDEECIDQFPHGKIFVDKHTNNVYNVLLTKTDSATNVNKFYTIQLVVANNGKEYHVFRKWGRFGGGGTGPMNGSLVVDFGADKNEAIDAFREKFLECTGIDFDLRGVVAQKPGRYANVELSGQEPDHPARIAPKKFTSSSALKSTLPKPLLDLIELIFDIEMIEREMSSSMDIDTSRLPPNALSKRQLAMGLAVLKEIENILTPDMYEDHPHTHPIDGASQELVLRDCANRFYTLIPHCFDRKQIIPIIDNVKKLRRKILNIEDLMQIVELEEIRSSSVAHAETLHRPIPDVQYEELGCKLEIVHKTSDEWNLICKAIAETHAPTHDEYSMVVDKVFKIERNNEWETFKTDPCYADVEHRKLLWHGSRISNWASILKNGLRIAPKEAPVTGYMFGKGVYFADSSSKSANYCFPTKDEPDGLLVLCDVALGKPYMRLEAQYEAPNKCKKKGFDSTWGVGELAPLKQESFPDGSVIPIGEIEKNDEMIKLAKNEWPRAKPALQYNEYIVYRESQLAMKYIVHVKFNFTKNKR